MIKHIVLWKLKEEAGGKGKKENAAALKSKLEALKPIIPQILELEVGLQMEPNESVFDVALYSIFTGREELEAYQKHPEHQKVVEFVRSVTADRKVVDYEV